MFSVTILWLVYWRSTPQRLLAPRLQRSSLAQQLNEDILAEILEGLANADLASAALVCREWLPQARWMLYHELHFDTGSAAAPQLRETLISSPEIRGLVRCIHLRHALSKTGSITLLDWIGLLPENSLQLAETRMLSFKPGDEVAIPFTQYPAIRSAPYLSLRCASFCTVDRLNQIFAYRNVERLSLGVLHKPEEEVLQLSPDCLPKLKRLSLTIYEYGPLVSQILQSVYSPLEEFNFLALTLYEADVAALSKDVQRHLPSLRSASFMFHYLPHSPFLDSIVPSMVNLETLACGFGTHTAQIIDWVASPLASFTTTSSPRKPFPSDEYADKIEQGALPALGRFTVLDTVHYRQAAACASLSQACARRHILFKTIDKEPIDPCA